MSRHKEIHAAVKEMVRHKEHDRVLDVLQKFETWLSQYPGSFAEGQAADDLWASAGLSRAGDGDVEMMEVLQVSDDDEEDAIDVEACDLDVVCTKDIKQEEVEGSVQNNNNNEVRHPRVKVEAIDPDNAADVLAGERGGAGTELLLPQQAAGYKQAQRPPQPDQLGLRSHGREGGHRRTALRSRGGGDTSAGGGGEVNSQIEDGVGGVRPRAQQGTSHHTL
jgi:hypothetical protein